MEVNFDKYCKICTYKHLPPTTLPCDDCNEIFYNSSEKPKYFVPEEEEQQ